MKKGFALKILPAFLSAALLSTFLSACIRDVKPPEEDLYKSLPEAQILGAGFYLTASGADVTGDNAGYIFKNEDGPGYTVRIRRRQPSTSMTSMMFSGSFEFSDFYRIIATFPEDAAHKPHRLYAFASRIGNTVEANADWATANDLVGQAAFRTGFAEGTVTLTNEGINKLAVGRTPTPYVNIVLYFYFNTPSDISNPDDYYEFILEDVSGGYGVTPASVVEKAAVYRSGDADAANHFILERRVEDTPEDLYSPTRVIPVLARYNHLFNSGSRARIASNTPLIGAVNTQSLNVGLKVPDADAGKEIVFEVRDPGLFAGASDNMIGPENRAAAVLDAAGAPDATADIEEVPIANSGNFFYRIRAAAVAHDDLLGDGQPGVGIKMQISGEDGETFNDIDRFSIALFLPDEFVEDD